MKIAPVNLTRSLSIVSPTNKQNRISFTSNKDTFVNKNKNRLPGYSIRETLKHGQTIKEHSIALLKRAGKIKENARREYSEVADLIAQGAKNNYQPTLDANGNIIRSFEVSSFGQPYMIEVKDKKITRMVIFDKKDFGYSLSILKNVKGNYPPNYAQHCYTFKQGKLTDYKKGCYKYPDGSKEIKEEFKFDKNSLSVYKKDYKLSFDGSIECAEVFSYEPLLNMLVQYQKNSKKDMSQAKGYPLHSAQEIIYFRNNKIDELRNYKNFGGDCYKESYERIRFIKDIQENPIHGIIYGEITDFTNRRLTRHCFNVNHYSQHFNFDN